MKKGVPVDDIIKVYTINKNIKLVNINSDIKDKIKKYIRDTYRIQDNKFLMTSTALLLALYKGH